MRLSTVCPAPAGTAIFRDNRCAPHAFKSSNILSIRIERFQRFKTHSQRVHTRRDMFAVRCWHSGTPNVSREVRSLPNVEYFAPDRAAHARRWGTTSPLIPPLRTAH
jgi:hypothetical protein